ncbi:MAG TPA: YifB family Mg chelatase-like AAA ATPase [Solirubrobacterales bacterium]|nr:YifB family Mg chelatase-like AAA ATPase [Solirubrobacterales bacterium]
MAIARIQTFTLLGVDAFDVTVEVDATSGGLPAFSLVGLPDTAVRESRERVRAAIENSGFDFPRSRIVASLAPADLRKVGPGFDLSIAAGLLVSSGQLPADALRACAMAAELGLDGGVRSVPGAIAMAERAGELGLKKIIVAGESAAEAAMPAALGAHPCRVVPIGCLRDLTLVGTPDEPVHSPPDIEQDAPPEFGVDLDELRGQPNLRGALEAAAAGGHGMLILGPPGAGKSLAARRLPTIMPPLDDPEAMEVLRIASACGTSGPNGNRRRPHPAHRPFRAPHHTISPAGLVGGGNPPRPGEVTLAHRGVLFLDELGEFSRNSLEALRQPLEDGEVTISRVRHSVRLPSCFVLIAASNPCPCGHGEDSPKCNCSALAAQRYRNRISGALADRIDISILIEQPTPESLAGEAGESSAAVRERVIRARRAALARQGCANAELGPTALREHVPLSREARRELSSGHAALALSGRGHDRVRRVARTLADLAGREQVAAEDVYGALGFRRRSSK